MKIFITGGAGYVGGMLADQFSKRSDVDRVIALDKSPQPEFLKGNKKVLWIDANTSDGSWQKKVAGENPDVVVHAAWQIREMYGKQDVQWKWNVEGSDAIFNFAFSTPSVKKLVHFSTASGYGAEETNTMEHLFAEDEKLRERTYLYGIEKIEAERRLRKLFDTSNKNGNHVPQVVVVRPAAITGPRGRGIETRFGLQSALSGTLKGSWLYSVVRALVSFVPATHGWCRQFIHEDDVNDIVVMFATEPLKSDFDVFNITPNSIVRPRDMGEVLKKRVINLPPWLIRIAFFLFWHGTRGKIPTARGSWKFYSYPVVMDGSKLTRVYGYKYRWQSKDAFSKNEGRYVR